MPAAVQDDETTMQRFDHRAAIMHEMLDEGQTNKQGKGHCGVV